MRRLARRYVSTLQAALKERGRLARFIMDEIIRDSSVMIARARVLMMSYFVRAV